MNYTWAQVKNIELVTNTNIPKQFNSSRMLEICSNSLNKA
ncbi:hypothetical protein NSP_43100 [Nodularia spumigena CCY9414]|nr:hypothetical protein NSP_43100 [Nodularia spumigena CCY9414]